MALREEAALRMCPHHPDPNAAQLRHGRRRRRSARPCRGPPGRTTPASLESREGSWTSSNTPKAIVRGGRGARRSVSTRPSLPGLQVDLGRGCRGEHEAPGGYPHANQSPATVSRRGMQVGNVAACIAQTWKAVQSEHVAETSLDVPGRHGCAPPIAHRARRRRAVARSPRAGRVDEVRGRRWRRGPERRVVAHEYPRTLPHGPRGCASAGGGGCPPARARGRRDPFECRDAARRAAVDDGRPIVGLDDICGDGTLRAMVQVDRRAHPRASSVPAALGARRSLRRGEVQPSRLPDSCREAFV